MAPSAPRDALLDGAHGSSSKSAANSSAVTFAIFLVLVAALGPLVFGYTLGFSSPAQLAMEAGTGKTGVFGDLKLSTSGGLSLTSEHASLFGALTNVGSMVGALCGGALANGVGRKLAIASSALPWIIGWTLLALVDSYPLLLVARLLQGCAVGIASMSVPLYIAEVSPTSIRGALGAVNQLAVVIGIFAVYALGFAVQEDQPTSFPFPDLHANEKCEFVADGDTTARKGCADVVKQWACSDTTHMCHGPLARWRVLAWVGAAMSIALLVLALILLPESPKFLAEKGKLNEARRVLARRAAGPNGRTRARGGGTHSLFPRRPRSPNPHISKRLLGPRLAGSAPPTTRWSRRWRRSPPRPTRPPTTRLPSPPCTASWPTSKKPPRRRRAGCAASSCAACAFPS